MTVNVRWFVAAIVCLGLIGCNTAQQPSSNATNRSLAGSGTKSALVIYPIIGRYSGSGDVFIGGSVDNLIQGSYPLRARSRATGVACEVAANAPVLAATDAFCRGHQGTVSFSCENGLSVETTWQAESCSSGYGFSVSQDGNRFDFAFGMPRTMALAHFDRMDDAEGQVATIVTPPASQSEPPLVLPEVADGPTVAEPQTAAVVAPVEPVEEPKKKAVLAVDDLHLFGNGTGFFVTRDGYLLTNFHVVEEADVVAVAHNEELHPASVERVDRSNDLALLKIDAASDPLPLPPVPTYERGSEVMTLGYPFASLNAASQKATFGRVNDLSGLFGDPRHLQVDVPIQPGNSGGPLFNTRGEVIGVVVGAADDMTLYEASGALPQNMNFAVKADYVRPLVNGLESSTVPAGSSGDLTFAELADQYEESVVLVLTFETRGR